MYESTLASMTWEANVLLRLTEGLFVVTCHQ